MMASAKCPTTNCDYTFTALPKDFDGTIQCQKCTRTVRIVVKDDRPADVRLRTIDFAIPAELPAPLAKIIDEAIACFEVGSNAATVVLAGLAVEGMLRESKITGKTLADMIEKAHAAGAVSLLGRHVATASRLMRNMGAHYSADLAKLSRSDARLALELTRKIADDLGASGRFSK